MDLRTNYKYEIATPTGFQPFIGVRKTSRHSFTKITTDKYEITCSGGHKVITETGWTEARDVSVMDVVETSDGPQTVVNVAHIEERTEFFEPICVGGGSAYISNGIISHNCEFLSSDALLINSMKLNSMRWEEPLWTSMGFKFWVPEEQLGGRNKVYMVSMDPATGSGNDFTAIEVFDFPSLTQVAEYRTNDVNIPLTYAKLTWILRKLTELKTNGRSEVLWTFERNGIGEAISALYYNDEKQLEEAELVSDHPAKFGVFTTGRQKVLAALQLKSILEKVSEGNLTIKSDKLVYELKHFVAKGGGYEAKKGYTDDCVMATLGIMRLLKRLSEYNEEAFKKVHEYVDPESSMDESDDPMPFAIV